MVLLVSLSRMRTIFARVLGRRKQMIIVFRVYDIPVPLSVCKMSSKDTERHDYHGGKREKQRGKQ